MKKKIPETTLTLVVVLGCSNDNAIKFTPVINKNRKDPIARISLVSNDE